MLGQGQLQGGLLWSYLGHGALVGHCELEDSLHNPAFMEYTSRVFGDITVVVRDCPSWVREGGGHRLGKVIEGVGGGEMKMEEIIDTELHHSQTCSIADFIFQQPF